MWNLQRRNVGGMIATCAVTLSLGYAAHAQEAPKTPETKAADTKAAPATPDPGGKITVTGFLDGYYQYSFNRPPLATNLGGRQFDVKHDNFSIAVAEATINKSVSAASPVGFTATLTVGKNADLVHATEPGGANTYRYLQQIFGTYLANANGKMPITIDFGKYQSWIGYEVIESANNDNYSRSFLFTFGQPLYHTGLRVTAPLTPAITGGLYLVNGWNEVEDANGGKTFGASVNYGAGKPLNLVLSWIGGDEGGSTTSTSGTPPVTTVSPLGGIGFSSAGIRNTHLFDLIAVYQATAKLKIGLNADYASASAKGSPGGNWNGIDVYGRYQFTPTSAFAARFDHFEDSAGLRTGTAQNLNSITATLENVVKSNLVLRLEFRHDKAGKTLFPSGGGGSTSQDSITVSGVIKL